MDAGAIGGIGDDITYVWSADSQFICITGVMSEEGPAWVGVFDAKSGRQVTEPIKFDEEQHGIMAVCWHPGNHGLILIWDDWKSPTYDQDHALLLLKFDC